MSVAIKPHEFKESIAEIAHAFRQKIELEVEAFAADEDARKNRIAKVFDPVTGYQFFAETYFPHYLIKGPSELHELLYADLPVMVSDPKGIKKLIIAPRGSAKSTHVSLIFPLWCVTALAKADMATTVPMPQNTINAAGAVRSVEMVRRNAETTVQNLCPRIATAAVQRSVMSVRATMEAIPA